MNFCWLDVDNFSSFPVIGSCQRWSVTEYASDALMLTTVTSDTVIWDMLTTVISDTVMWDTLTTVISDTVMWDMLTTVI